MARVVMIADDLTGAADCAASSAALDHGAVVLLHSPQDEQLDVWPDTDILSIDANSRCLPAQEASELTARVIQQCDLHNASNPGYVLYKKIDSTLRGNVATEIAALLKTRRSGRSADSPLSVVMTPALPAQGRTVVDGRLLVHGAPLEQTSIWKLETRTTRWNIPALLAGAGLISGLIDLHTVRSGASLLEKAILQSAKQNDVVVCDAETDTDLRVIAQASLSNPAITALVGSAGLASQMLPEIQITKIGEPHKWVFAAGPTLFVVGTVASVSQEQAQWLETISEITSFRATPAKLSDSPELRVQIVQSLRSGRDVLLNMEGGEHCLNSDDRSLTVAISDLVTKCAEFVGGLVATGGETARAILDAMRIHRLRLLDEVEAGLPFSVADGWVRPLPIITKAGAFGSPQALVRCHEYLRGLERVPVRLDADKVLES